MGPLAQAPPSNPPSCLQSISLQSIPRPYSIYSLQLNLVNPISLFNPIQGSSINAIDLHCISVFNPSLFNPQHCLVFNPSLFNLQHCSVFNPALFNPQTVQSSTLFNPHSTTLFNPSLFNPHSTTLFNPSLCIYVPHKSF